MFLQRSLLPIALVSSLCPTLGHAVFITPPSSSAGVVERPIEKEYEAKPIPPEKELPLLEYEEPEDKLDLDDNETVFVKSLWIRGNTLFSTEELHNLVREKIPGELSIKEIREICDTIKAHYVKEGYFLTRVYPPAQEITSGNLTIEIMEGRLGQVSVVGNKHYKTSFIEKYFSRLKGKPVNYDQFIKTLLLLNENSDMSAGAIFKKGEEPGTTDVIVRVEDKLPSHLYFNYNNYGSNLNSKNRFGGRFDYGNILGNGDHFSFAAVGGTPIKRLGFFDLIYDVPVYVPAGTKLSLSFLHSNFRVSEFDPLHLKGRSSIGAIKLTQPHMRTRTLNTDYTLVFDFKEVRNLSGNETLSIDKLREVTFGIHIDYIDDAKGRNLIDFALMQGIPGWFGGSPAKSSDGSRPGGGGLFTILRPAYKRLQQLPADAFLLFNFNGQYSPYKLPLAEQFYIGGADTVRGYPLASGLGDSGYFLNVEARLPPFGFSKSKTLFKNRTWKEILQFIAFLDHGQTFLNNHPSNETHHVQMTSAGFGLRLSFPYDLDFSFDLGFPLTKQKRSSSPVAYFKVTWQAF